MKFESFERKNAFVNDRTLTGSDNSLAVDTAGASWERQGVIRKSGPVVTKKRKLDRKMHRWTGNVAQEMLMQRNVLVDLGASLCGARCLGVFVLRSPLASV